MVLAYGESGEAGFTRTPEQIVRLFKDRQKTRGPVLARMAQIRDHYNADVIVPLPQMDKDEQSFVANLLQQGLDQIGGRMASTMPSLTCPPGDPRKPRSRERADVRKRATLAWWEANDLKRMLRRRARWLVGYASAPASIRPDFERGIPRWLLRNPLCAFPAPTVNPDDLRPSDTIFAVRKPLGVLRREYGPEILAGLAPDDASPDLSYTVLEYDDAEQIACVVVGQHGESTGYGLAEHVLLEQVPNRAGIPLSTNPGRITLDRPGGQFDGILGMYQMQAKLMALEVLAVQRGVFPDMFVIGRDGRTPQIDGGTIKPGYSGLVNVITDGEFREVSVNPGFATNQTVDRLERAQRLTAGIPADFGGESTQNVRTGRRGDALLSAVVDFPLQEGQETLAAALEEENRSATKVAKAYFGNLPRSFHVGWKGAKGHVTYKANDFDSDYTQVAFPSPGSDINNLTIGIGQRVGMGIMSKQTAMRIDPMVDDADLEGDLVQSEGIEAAALQAFQAQAANGAIPIGDAARIQQLVVEDNMPFFKAVLQAQQEAQERQSTTVNPVEPGAPEAQPGLASPGAGAEAGVAIPEPGPSLNNLDQLLMNLRGTAAGAGASV